MHRIFLGHRETGAIMFATWVLALFTWWASALAPFNPIFIVALVPAIIVGAWWLLDLVLLVSGALKPKDGTRLV